MKSANLSDLQEEELKIFKIFVEICEKNNIRYFLAGGSFLGAVRHKGFIPWDDDIDVAIPRPDYERFLEIAPELLPDNLYLSTYKLGRDHNTLVGMIINKSKEFTLNNSVNQVKIGAWIDLLVIDGAPKQGIRRKIFKIKYLYYRMMNQFAHFNEVVNLYKERPLHEKFAIRFAQVTNIEYKIDPIKIGDKFHALLKRYPYEETREIATYMGAAKMNEIVPREYYGIGTDYEFEDMIVKGPDMADAFLSHFYGDYMKLPPMKDRNRHNVRRIGE